ncbi:kinase-like domain-containing protein [Glomus cerebriforme]|uniref:Kinase-like domain-containing protein n=1 Tax=Glomus cerebriforme TaxID=658196 RepID=A0A397SWK3_9GLOM|nr:kinase-like domain-containing protein [Glomus cerebriforme]
MNLYNNHNLMLYIIKSVLNGYLLEILKMLLILRKVALVKFIQLKWPKGYIWYWNIANKEWIRVQNEKVALKRLDNSSDINLDFLNEIKSHLQIYLYDIIQCYGITQDPNTKHYMIVLQYCDNGNSRNYYSNEFNSYYSKISYLFQIIGGLLDIHNAGKVHKDFHSGNILLHNDCSYISDLGMCQPANNEQPDKKEGIYGVLPYMAPEILRGHQYTKESDIYSFGIMMNEYISEEIPYNNIPHDHILANNVCKGLRPKISEDTPKLLADLITKCWDAKAENRPIAKEIYQILNKLNNEKYDEDSEIYFQIEECKKMEENKLKNRSIKKKLKNIQTHPQEIYTSRLLNFKNLPEPVNSGNFFNYFYYCEKLTILIIIPCRTKCHS